MTWTDHIGWFVGGFLICLVILLPVVIFTYYPIAVNQNTLETELADTGMWFDEFSGTTWVRCNCSDGDWYIAWPGKQTDRERLCDLLNVSKDMTRM